MLYKRGSVWWCDFTDAKGERHRFSTRQTDKRAAERVERRERERAAMGEVRAVPTLKEAAAAWFTARAEGKRSVVDIARRIQTMLRLMGADTPVNEIGPREIEAAIQVRRLEAKKRGPKGTAIANATINRDLIGTTLRPILRYASEIMEAPVRPIPWAKLKLPENNERDRAFTTAEMTAWKEALPLHHQPIFDFIARYGVRLNEAFFPPESYDPTEGRVFIRHRKGGKPHAIRLLPEDRADLAARYGRAVAAGLPSLWFREDEGELRPILSRGFQAASRRALDAAGIVNARPAHDLRHHAAMTMLRATGKIESVRKLLGHETLMSTMRYARAAEEDVLEALRHTYGTAESVSEEITNKNKAKAS